jgi:hypothetical protein
MTNALIKEFSGFNSSQRRDFKATLKQLSSQEVNSKVEFGEYEIKKLGSKTFSVHKNGIYMKVSRTGKKLNFRRFSKDEIKSFNKQADETFIPVSVIVKKIKEGKDVTKDLQWNAELAAKMNDTYPTTVAEFKEVFAEHINEFSKAPLRLPKQFSKKKMSKDKYVTWAEGELKTWMNTLSEYIDELKGMTLNADTITQAYTIHSDYLEDLNKMAGNLAKPSADRPADVYTYVLSSVAEEDEEDVRNKLTQLSQKLAAISNKADAVRIGIEPLSSLLSFISPQKKEVSQPTRKFSTVGAKVFGAEYYDVDAIDNWVDDYLKANGIKLDYAHGAGSSIRNSFESAKRKDPNVNLTDHANEWFDELLEGAGVSKSDLDYYHDIGSMLSSKYKGFSSGDYYVVFEKGSEKWIEDLESESDAKSTIGYAKKDGCKVLYQGMDLEEAKKVSGKDELGRGYINDYKPFSNGVGVLSFDRPVWHKATGIADPLAEQGRKGKPDQAMEMNGPAVIEWLRTEYPAIHKLIKTDEGKWGGITYQNWNNDYSLYVELLPLLSKKGQAYKELVELGKFLDPEKHFDAPYGFYGVQLIDAEDGGQMDFLQFSNVLSKELKAYSEEMLKEYIHKIAEGQEVEGNVVIPHDQEVSKVIETRLLEDGVEFVPDGDRIFCKFPKDLNHKLYSHTVNDLNQEDRVPAFVALEQAIGVVFDRDLVGRALSLREVHDKLEPYFRSFDFPIDLYAAALSANFEAANNGEMVDAPLKEIEAPIGHWYEIFTWSPYRANLKDTNLQSDLRSMRKHCFKSCGQNLSEIVEWLKLEMSSADTYNPYGKVAVDYDDYNPYGYSNTNINQTMEKQFSETYKVHLKVFSDGTKSPDYIVVNSKQDGAKVLGVHNPTAELNLGLEKGDLFDVREFTDGDESAFESIKSFSEVPEIDHNPGDVQLFMEEMATDFDTMSKADFVKKWGEMIKPPAIDHDKSKLLGEDEDDDLEESTEDADEALEVVEEVIEELDDKLEVAADNLETADDALEDVEDEVEESEVKAKSKIYSAKVWKVIPRQFSMDTKLTDEQMEMTVADLIGKLEGVIEATENGTPENSTARMQLGGLKGMIKKKNFSYPGMTDGDAGIEVYCEAGDECLYDGKVCTVVDNAIDENGKILVVCEGEEMKVPMNACKFGKSFGNKKYGKEGDEMYIVCDTPGIGKEYHGPFPSESDAKNVLDIMYKAMDDAPAGMSRSSCKIISSLPEGAKAYCGTMEYYSKEFCGPKKMGNKEFGGKHPSSLYDFMAGTMGIHSEKVLDKAFNLVEAGKSGAEVWAEMSKAWSPMFDAKHESAFIEAVDSLDKSMFSKKYCDAGDTCIFEGKTCEVVDPAIDSEGKIGLVCEGQKFRANVDLCTFSKVFGRAIDSMTYVGEDWDEFCDTSKTMSGSNKKYGEGCTGCKVGDFDATMNQVFGKACESPLMKDKLVEFKAAHDENKLYMTPDGLCYADDWDEYSMDQDGSTKAYSNLQTGMEKGSEVTFSMFGQDLEGRVEEVDKTGLATVKVFSDGEANEVKVHTRNLTKKFDNSFEAAESRANDLTLEIFDTADKAGGEFEDPMLADGPKIDPSQHQTVEGSRLFSKNSKISNFEKSLKDNDNTDPSDVSILDRL